MSKPKLSLDRPRLLFAISFLLLAILYPGQNKLQTTIISPGEVLSYTLPDPVPVLYPKNLGANIPFHTARGVIIQDLDSKAILYSYNPDLTLAPASLTKLMTALVAIDHYSLNSVLEVKNEDRAIGQTINLIAGEKLTFKDLLSGLLIHSGNDAALALADNFPGGYQEFVRAMNAKAKSIHMDNTVFKNPSGIDQYGHVSTPRDIAILASQALASSTIAEIVQTKSLTISDISGQQLHSLETTNKLLGSVAGLKGLKTGFTAQAGECLVSYVERGDQKVIVVVLGSSDRFGESERLINWAYDNHEWITPDL